MSLGLPASLAPNAIRRSFVAAQHAVASTLFSIAALLALVFQPVDHSPILWVSMVAVFPALGLLIVSDRVEVVRWTLSFLLVGGVGVYLYALGMLSPAIPLRFSNGFAILPAKVALIMVGGATLGVLWGIILAVVGYLVAELAVWLALMSVGGAFHFDVPALAALLLTVAIILVLDLNSSQQRRVYSRFRRAAQDEQLASLKYRIQAKSASLMHDTVLNHLAAIANLSDEVLPGALRTAIRQDVKSLMGGELLVQNPETVPKAQPRDWQQSGLFVAIQESRSLGLEVRASGEVSAVSKLDLETSNALGLAVKQCLVNVLEHSGVRSAEVGVYRSEREVSVMVVDNGCGFDQATTGADRLGLRTSVRERIELVGGTVTVWSAGGRGTSILITVPMLGEPASRPDSGQERTR